MNTRVSGVGGDVHLTSKFSTYLVLNSQYNNQFSLQFSAFVVDQPTALLPKNFIGVTTWPHIQRLQLADPDFNTPGDVDCILGADVYSSVLRQGARTGQPGEPVAQETIFGWIITGPTSSNADTQTHHIKTHFTCLRSDLKKFWKVQELPSEHILSKKDEECERHFVETHARDETGRFVLRLPLDKLQKLPGSKAIATARFLSLERKLQAVKKAAYQNFIKEFLDLGHMEPVPPEEEEIRQFFCMPHHAVMKQDGSEKIRVVSTPPKLLEMVFHLTIAFMLSQNMIISYWRLHRYVCSADIIKRRFRAYPDDTNWLRILWRDSPKEPLRSYRMLTEVYSTKPAPYQVIRALHQLVQDQYY